MFSGFQTPLYPKRLQTQAIYPNETVETRLGGAIRLPGLRQGADGSSLSRLEQSLIFLTRDSHFQNSGLESGALHPQSDRRPMRTCDHSAGVAQNPNNVLALQAL